MKSKNDWKLNHVDFTCIFDAYIAYIWFQLSEWFGLKLGSSVQKIIRNEASRVNAYNFVVYDSLSSTKWHFIDSPLKCPPLAK